MQLNRIICVLSFSLLSSLLVSVNAQKVNNVEAQQRGQNIIISYDLTDEADVSLRVTSDNGKKRLQASSVSGDIGKHIEAGEQKRIVWDVLSDNDEDFKEQGVVFEVIARPVWKTFVLADLGISIKPNQWSGGVMVGMVKTFGWYAHARTNFSFTQPYTYVNRSTKDDYLFADHKRTTEIFADAGVVARLGIPLYLYVGAGYGERKVYWQLLSDGNTKYALYTPNSISGVSGNAGLMFSIRGFTMALGANTINFQYVELQAAFGWMF